MGLAASAAGGLVVGLVHALLVPGGLAGGLTAGTFQREVAVLGLVGLAGGLGGYAQHHRVTTCGTLADLLSTCCGLAVD